MIRTAKIYTHRTITLRDLKDFIAEAVAIGATDDQAVTVRQARETGYQMDPGGEVTIEISVGS